MEQTDTLTKPDTDVQTLKAETKEFQVKIDDLIISDQQSYDYANDLLKEAKKKIKIITDKLEPKKKKAYAAYKEWVDLINELTSPLKKIEKTIKNKIGTYLYEQEKKRREAIEKARRKEEEKRIRDAEVLSEQGLTDKADELMDKKVRVQTSKIAPKMEKGGTHVVEKWHAEATDKMALIKAVAEGKADPDCLEPNMSHLNKKAVEFKDAMSIPGVKAVKKISVSTRL